MRYIDTTVVLRFLTEKRLAKKFSDEFVEGGIVR